MTEFQIGDTVVLNSGGPDMKVISLSESGKLVCEWRKEGGETEQASFRQEMLTIVRKKDGEDERSRGDTLAPE